MREMFDSCLSELRALYARSQSLEEFAPLPDDLIAQDITPHYIPAARLMEEDAGLFTTEFAGMRDAFIAASPHAQWRETYKGTTLEADFLDRFACYCLIGGGGPFLSQRMGAYVVYMPPGLDYPWHHHPAEELYFILAGEADFHLEGSGTKTLGPGEHVFHPSSAPHATTTRDHPFMALVLWRGDMGTKPVLTYPEAKQ